MEQWLDGKEELLLTSEDTGIRKSIDLDFRTLPLTCVILSMFDSPFWPSPYKAGKFTLEAP